MKINILCDDSVDTNKVTQAKVLDDDECSQTIEVTSGAGCAAVDLNSIFAILDKYSYLWGGIMIAIGIFSTFFGRALFKFAIFIITFYVVTFVLIFVLYSLFLYNDDRTWLFWVMLSICVLIGAGVAFLFVKFENFGVALLGAAAGFIIGVLICSVI